MSKKPFFKVKCADYECFEDCESTTCEAIWYHDHYDILLPIE